MICPVCGKEFFTTYPDNWPFKHGDRMLCSRNCMMVRAGAEARTRAREPLLADSSIRKIWKKMRYSNRK